MGVGGESTLGLQFAPVVFQLPGGEPPFEPGTCVNSGCCRRLQHHDVAAVSRVAAAKEMILSHLHQRGGGGMGGQVTADAAAAVSGPHHHGHGIPADDILQLPFDHGVAGVGRLLLSRDTVDVGCAQDGFVERQTPFEHTAFQGSQDLPDTVFAVTLMNEIDGFEPLF